MAQLLPLRNLQASLVDPAEKWAITGRGLWCLGGLPRSLGLQLHSFSWIHLHGGDERCLDNLTLGTCRKTPGILSSTFPWAT